MAAPVLHAVSTQSPLPGPTLPRTLHANALNSAGASTRSTVTGEQSMTTGHDRPKRWSSWKIEVKVWQVLAALVILPIVAFWFMVVHQDDEILALVRNEVVNDAAGQRSWIGSFINTNDRILRDVAVTVDFLDNQDRTVGKAKAETAELTVNARLDLRAQLPLEAVRLRIYSVQWRMGRKAALMGPFREPWEFGYVMVDPAKIIR